VARCVSAVLCCLLLLGCESEESQPASDLQTSAQFTGGAACAACHVDTVAAWRESHHAEAMQPANDTTVLGNFDDAEFEYNGIGSRFYKRSDEYWVRTDGADGSLQDFQVAYTFGVEPLQQYLIALPAGKLQALSIAWDTRAADAGGQRWFHLYPDQNIDFRDPLHWTGRYQNWNTMCAECHSTDLDKNYRLESDSYATSWTSINVDCEACHGPGSLHVEAPASHALALAATPRQWIFDGERNTARRMPETPERRELETCAQCHSRRSQFDDAFLPGHALLDSFRPALLEPALYHADGQILDEVYVYGSFLQSAMHAAGVTCSDCHEPHTAKLRFEGNALCAQCHLPSAFDSSEHHGHERDSAGAQCAACHMPQMTYMVVDPRRDHSFRIPRPDLSAALGTPNACTQCHSDRSDTWASERIAAWPNTHRDREFHFGAALASGRNWQADRSPRLLQVLDDDNQSAIARASALSLLAWQYSDTLLSALERGLADGSPLVQLAALDALGAVPAQYRVTLAQRFLDAPLKSQRLAAARGLAAQRAQLSPQRQSDLDAAIEEYIGAQRFNGDRPEGLFNLAVLYAELGRQDEAQTLFETAIARAPAFTASYVNLADLYRNRGAEDQALVLLERAAADHPADAGIALALGLSLVRADRAAQAEPWLQSAVQLAPDSPYYAYVYGIALNSAGKNEQALEVLRTAQMRFPAYAELALALATMQRDRGESAAALEYARQLQRLLPADPRARSLIDELSGDRRP
jgi:tetratricopeptide (TPR) repeat protein